jgi:hypothetical protein
MDTNIDIFVVTDIYVLNKHIKRCSPNGNRNANLSHNEISSCVPIRFKVINTKTANVGKDGNTWNSVVGM